ncbi:hypothetical protein EW145_g3254 [Phellinidium pouzarii]|uniref:FAM192A/Fyv6 N-terminal domain-containing protein n=1 Tax=Phellinidium pouzarii TaxID=167371 RepID=A0A4S4L816_9AGAM|nr:hypothetical protein EW145_g3254 [Phellinidium pouzarii]
MEEALPTITSEPGSVGSRFVSQGDIDSARARRDEQWKAAYARLGQEPPPQPVEDIYDGRSLAEKLAANKAAKQEEWEEKSKLANQFRALEEDEVLFLDSIRNEQERQELKRNLEDAEEVSGFKQAVAARNALPEKPPTSVSSRSQAAPSNKRKLMTEKKTSGMKKALKGVIVRKKPRPTIEDNARTLSEDATVPKESKESKESENDR